MNIMVLNTLWLREWASVCVREHIYKYRYFSLFLHLFVWRIRLRLRLIGVVAFIFVVLTVKLLISLLYIVDFVSIYLLLLFLFPIGISITFCCWLVFFSLACMLARALSLFLPHPLTPSLSSSRCFGVARRDDSQIEFRCKVFSYFF